MSNEVAEEIVLNKSLHSKAKNLELDETDAGGYDRMTDSELEHIQSEDSDYESDFNYLSNPKYAVNYHFPVYTQRVVDALTDFHPKASFKCWFFAQTIAALLIIFCLAAIIIVTPFLLRETEWRKQQLQFEAFGESTNQVTINRNKFVTQIANVFNQTTPTEEDLTQMIQDFVQTTYIVPYTQNNDDVNYINDNAQHVTTWNYYNALQLLLSSILLTGTSEIQCTIVTCSGLLILATMFGLINVTIIISSSVSVIISVLQTIWGKILSIKKENKGAMFTKKEIQVVIFRDLLVMGLSLTIFIAAFLFAVFIVHKDQITWSWSQIILYVYGQTTTLGVTQVVPYFISSEKVTFVHIVKYTGLTVWCIHYFALLLASIGCLFSSYYSSRYAVLDDEDYKHLLKVDEKLRNKKAEKMPKYFTN